MFEGHRKKKTDKSAALGPLGVSTLLLICPDVDTFLMSFCAPSCSASLSEESSAAPPTGTPVPAAAPTAWIPGRGEREDAGRVSGSCRQKEPELVRKCALLCLSSSAAPPHTSFSGSDAFLLRAVISPLAEQERLCSGIRACCRAAQRGRAAVLISPRNTLFCLRPQT